MFKKLLAVKISTAAAALVIAGTAAAATTTGVILNTTQPAPANPAATIPQSAPANQPAAATPTASPDPAGTPAASETPTDTTTAPAPATAAKPQPVTPAYCKTSGNYWTTNCQPTDPNAVSTPDSTQTQPVSDPTAPATCDPTICVPNNN